VLLLKRFRQLKNEERCFSIKYKFLEVRSAIEVIGRCEAFGTLVEEVLSNFLLTLVLMSAWKRVLDFFKPSQFWCVSAQALSSSYSVEEW